MALLPIKSPVELIEEIRSKLLEKPRKKGSAYALIVGAGFSHGVVPLTKELLHERIGDFCFPKDMSMEGATERTSSQRQRLSRKYWKEFNDAGEELGEVPIELNRRGLPVNPSEAYQFLFDYRVANALFAPDPDAPVYRFLSSVAPSGDGAGEVAERPVLAGEKFVKEFLQDVLDQGGYINNGLGVGDSHDYCSTGRNKLNAAHFFLASLLELQQSGELFNFRPFCRTIFTTNFDTLLQNALQVVNVLYCLSDRPERGLDLADFPDERAIHLVYTHGSILRHNAASTGHELAELTMKNTETIARYLETRDVLVFGYGGWEDTLMSALLRCATAPHRLYWCNIYSPEEAPESLGEPVTRLLEIYGKRAFYVPLGPQGADGFMADLYRALAPDGAVPSLLSDPLKTLADQLHRLSLGNVMFAAADPEPSSSTGLPLPKLERSAGLIPMRLFAALNDARTSSGCTPGFSEYGQNSGKEAQALLLLERGFVLAVKGDSEDAIDVWSRIESKASEFEAALGANYTGIVQARAGNFEQAVEAFTRAFQLSKTAPGLIVESLTNRGVARYHLGQEPAAMDDLSEAIRRWEPRPWEVGDAPAGRALIYRGLLRQWRGDREGALVDFNRATGLKETPPECLALIERSGKS
jgi:tetratricopeptide (TPR) repeat protein